jgi:hypothetical protein
MNKFPLFTSDSEAIAEVFTELNAATETLITNLAKGIVLNYGT